MLNGYLAPMHMRPIQDIRRRDVAALIGEIAKTTGAPTASLVRSMLGRLFSWAVEVDYLDANPVTGTPSYAVGKRSRVLSDAELRAIWKATEEPADYHLIVRILLWTGCRRGEAGGMRWSELDGTRWTIPGSRTKNHRELALPLPDQVVDAIEGWRRIARRELLFGRHSARGFTTWNDAKDRLDAVLKFEREWDLHDCRRTVETRMAGLGTPKDHVNRVLNHAAGPVTEAYDHYHYMPEKAEALRKWADRLAEIVCGDKYPSN